MNQEKVAELVQRGQVTRLHELSPDGLQWRRAELFTEFYPQQEGSTTSSLQSTARTKSDGDELRLEEESIKVDRSNNQPKPEQWYAHIDGAQLGPVGEDAMKQWVASGQLTGNSLIWKEGMTEWLAASLIRPSWFRQVSTENRTTSVSDTDSEDALDALQELIMQQQLRRKWIYLIGVILIIFSSSQVVVGVLALLKELIAPADSGIAAIWGFLISLSFLAISINGMIASFRLIQYANFSKITKYAPSYDNVIQAEGILTRFWFFGGLYFLCNVLLIAFLFLLFYTVGLRISHLVGN